MKPENYEEHLLKALGLQSIPGYLKYTYESELALVIGDYPVITNPLLDFYDI